MRNSVNRVILGFVVFILVLGLIVPAVEPVKAGTAVINTETNDNTIGSVQITTAAGDYEGTAIAVSEQGSEAVQENVFVVFGPNDYICDKGKPETLIETFSILEPNKIYSIRIYNGGNQGQFEKLVSSAIITLNDNPVIRTKDFNGNVLFIEREIVLIENNQLIVELRSAPGSGLTIEIVTSNAPPVAIDDSAITDEDTPVTIDVLANDSDIDLDSLTVTSATDPAHGMVVINLDNTITYAPDENYSSVDSFDYTVYDGYGGVGTAIVTVAVTPVNDPPVAEDDSVITDEDTPVTIDVLANDSDIDGDSLTVTSATAPFHGMVVINPDNTITYAPDVNYNGGDFFNYTADDGYGGVDTATVTVSITPVNDSPPVAIDDSAITDEDTPVTIDVLANDSDIDGDPLTVTSTTAPAHGMVVINSDNTITYTPDENYSGEDIFDYTVDDGHGGVDTATVTVTVSISTIDVVPPTIIITSPLPDEHMISVFAVKSPIIITGNVTDFSSGIASVTCNGEPLMLSDSAFSCEVELVVGLNEVTIEAVDNAGNVASTIISFDYDDVEHLILEYGPILRFHPLETFLPDSVDAVLRESYFEWGHIENEYNYDLFELEQEGVIALGELDDPTDLETAMAMVDPGLKAWISIPADSKPGNIERAKSYVRLNRWAGTNILELQFWYFYPYNGPGQFRISAFGQDIYVFLEDNDEGIGKHHGDWECVTLRFSRDEDSAEPYTLLSVGMSAHGVMKVFTTAELQLIGGHPVVYAAWESHAHYPNLDYLLFYYMELFDYFVASGYSFDVIAYLPDGPPQFEINDENYEVISAEVTAYDVNQEGLFAEWTAGACDIQDPKWLSFQGRWGQYEKLYYNFLGVYPYKQVGGGPTGPKMKPEWLVGWPY